jgi:uncharacterized protein YbcC (UPF0753/DUF2309 family)
VDLLDMELAYPASPYQLNGILNGCRLVKTMPKGFTDQHAIRFVVAALTSMDLCEQLAAFFTGYAPQ